MCELEKIWRDLGEIHWKALQADKVKVPVPEVRNLLGESYWIDPASLLVANSLEAKSGMSFLDACAAPGGKALASLAGKNLEWGEVVLNEKSLLRMKRLRASMEQFLPGELRPKIRFIQKDASLLFRSFREHFDFILADVPCSGDRGLVKKCEFSQWSAKKSKRMALRQYSILASLFLCLRAGGRIVYSTCTASPHENDEVIRKLLHRKSGEVSLLGVSPPHGQLSIRKTEFGCLVLPTLAANSGPMYFSVLIKT